MRPFSRARAVRVLAGVLALVVAALLGVTGVGPAAARAHRPAYDPPRIAWSDCDLGYGPWKCGDLVVPLDYADPTGRTIRLAVTLRPHTSSAADYQGPLVLNPGGPGASGRTLPSLADSVPGGRRGAAGDYDWVGYDPRGVGSSTPALRCKQGYFGVDRPSYVPSTARLMRIWRHRAASYAAACAASPARELLGHLSTRDNVLDLESLRRALGAPQMSFYGFSYGSYLGQVYATEFPTRIHRMVLDGIVSPSGIWYGDNLAQDTAFDRAMNAFYRWVAMHPRAYHLGRHWRAIRHDYYASLRRLRTHPWQHQLGPDELSDAMLLAGYYAPTWPTVADAFSRLVRRHDGFDLMSIYESGDYADDNAYAVYTATQCTDSAWPRAWSRWAQDTWNIYRTRPFVAWNNTWYNAPCLTWRARPTQPVEVNGRALHQPVLLINETRDAATPFPGALEVRRRFPTARLVAGLGGTTHAGSLNGVPCVDDTIARYLRDGQLPRRRPGNRWDKGCPAVSPNMWFGARRAPAVHDPVRPSP